MSLSDILYKILLGPLELIFEIVFSLAQRIAFNSPALARFNPVGISIIALSIAINLLVLPLYRRADALQEEERDIQNRLKPGVDHIKKVFSGDERMMMLQTYYRQNNYKPTYVLRSAVSLLLQIPFFIVAYRFLSDLELLRGSSFGPITDLGAPDALLRIGGVTLNLLPILMTAVNIVSSIIYTRGHPLKTKLQLYAIALFFLVFLYSSPSGLVFYWTLNNVFSLLKNIFYKLKHSKIILCALASAAGISCAAIAFAGGSSVAVNRKLLLFAAAAALQIPLFAVIFGKRLPADRLGAFSRRSDPKLFGVGALFLTVLAGLLIPSALIGSSPQEFMPGLDTFFPIAILISTACAGAGMFCIWLGVFYRLASEKGKIVFEYAVAVVSAAAAVNYMFFGRGLGKILSDLRFENGLVFTTKQMAVNFAVILLCSAAALLFAVKYTALTKRCLAVGLTAILVMSCVNISAICKDIYTVSNYNNTDEKAEFTLSKEGKNVVVIMLDRAIGAYVPYMFNEKPELKEKFSGFTYYSNTVSFGLNTNTGAPALYGGYEYTPAAINSRPGESLKDKHNEALRVMPVLFSENGYDVTVCDPPYANYQWIPDLSIYDDHPEIHKFITTEDLGSLDVLTPDYLHRNMYCYSLMKIMPLAFQSMFYDQGKYNHPSLLGMQTKQNVTSLHTASGISSAFMKYYNVLENMPDMTRIDDGGSDNFLVMCNNATHEMTLLQEPEYAPAIYVDNEEYDLAHSGRFTVDGRTMGMDYTYCYCNYQVNMASMLALGEWFDHLRENGVYDNTRIIIVSDHGAILNQFDELMLDFDDGTFFDAEVLAPLLLFKDFGTEGFTESDEFMTNGDVPSLAVKDIIENPVNPFTGNVISDSEKHAHRQYILSEIDENWDVNVNNGNRFLPAPWYSVGDNIWDKSSWKKESDNAVLDYGNIGQ